MIPCLYSQSETLFSSNGIGKLCDAVSCKVTEKRNGAYELKMTYPLDGLHADRLIEDNIILAKPSEQGNPQPFRIYHVSTPLNGLLEINARHISYQQNQITVSPFTAQTAQTAMSGLRTNAASACPFSFETDIVTEKDFTVTVPSTIRSCLGSMDGSILETYGGEFEWDMYRTILHAHRGADHGVKIVYGKNLIDFKMERSIDSLMTGVHPYWYKQDSESGEETLIELPEKVITTNIGQAFERIEPLNCSSVFSRQPTLDQIREYARWYLQDEKFSRPDADITIKFAQLWRLPGYEDIVEAERVSLCDTVHVFISRLNLEISYTVTETEYNVLLERYDSIVLSNETVRSKNKRSYFVGTIADLQAQADATEATALRNSADIQQVSFKVQEEVEGLESSISETASQIRSEVSDSVNGLTSSIGETASQIRSEISDSVNGLNSSITETASQIRSEVSDSVNGLTSSITETASQIRSEVSDSVNGLSSSITETASQIRAELTDSVNGLSSSITATASQIRAELNDSVNGLNSSISATASQLRAEWSDSVNGLNSSITATASQIRSEVNDTVNSVRSSFTQTASQIRQEISSATSAASIVQSINDAGSSIVISANHIALNGQTVADSLSSDEVLVNELHVTSLYGGSVTANSIILDTGHGQISMLDMENSIEDVEEAVDSAVASIGPASASGGQITIPWTKIDGTSGTPVNFNMAATQWYADQVAAFKSAVSTALGSAGWNSSSYNTQIHATLDTTNKRLTVNQAYTNIAYPGDQSATQVALSIGNLDLTTALTNYYNTAKDDGYNECANTVDLKWYDTSNSSYHSLAGANYAFEVDTSGTWVYATYNDSSGVTHYKGREIKAKAVTIYSIAPANDANDGYNSSVHKTRSTYTATASNGATKTVTFWSNGDEYSAGAIAGKNLVDYVTVSLRSGSSVVYDSANNKYSQAADAIVWYSDQTSKSGLDVYGAIDVTPAVNYGKSLVDNTVYLWVDGTKYSFPSGGYRLTLGHDIMVGTDESNRHWVMNPNVSYPSVSGVIYNSTDHPSFGSFYVRIKMSNGTVYERMCSGQPAQAYNNY